MRLTGFVLLASLSLGVAGYALAVHGWLPLGTVLHPDMRAAFQAHPVGIHLHVFASVVALALGPFQFSGRLRGRHPRLHRWCGRLYLGVGVLIGGSAVRNFALTFAAVTLRLHVPASVAAGVAFETAYPVIAWLCRIPNLVVAELWFNQRPDRAPAPASRSGAAGG